MPEETQIGAITTSTIHTTVAESSIGMGPWNDMWDWLYPEVVVVGEGGDEVNVTMKVLGQVDGAVEMTRVDGLGPKFGNMTKLVCSLQAFELFAVPDGIRKKGRVSCG